MSSKFQENRATCMRLAQESDEAVLSLCYGKLADAWSQLEKGRRTRGLRARSRHTRSRQMNRRARLASYRTKKRSKNAA